MQFMYLFHFLLTSSTTSYLSCQASILLNANVAFLAIPSNDSGNDFQRLHRSPTQIASYLSIVGSSASMLLALLLIRQTKLGNVVSNQIYFCRYNASIRTWQQNMFLKKSDHPAGGLERLAILYSLPYVLLIWG